VELVIVVVIIGIVAAIAVPRLAGATERATSATLAGQVRTFQNAVDLYAAEHDGRTPAHDADGNIDADAARFAQRLLERTDTLGHVVPGGEFGPYLRAIPVNPVNKRDSLRVVADPPDADGYAWRFVVSTSAIESDCTE